MLTEKAVGKYTRVRDMELGVKGFGSALGSDNHVRSWASVSTL